MPRIKQSFDVRLRRAIEDSGLTQAELAEKTAINRSTLFNWVAGRCRPSSFASVDAVANALGVKPRALLG